MTGNLSPLITVVLTTYRRPYLLRRALLSVLSQTCTQLRVHVCDNASEDETENIVREIARTDSRVLYFGHTENIGYSANVSFGLKSITTPYFSILSDDDLLISDFCERALAGFAQYPEAFFFAFRSIRVSGSGIILAEPISSEKSATYYFEPGEAFKPLVTGKIEMPWVGTVFRREVIEELGPPNSGTGPHVNDSFMFHVVTRYAGGVSSAVGCLIAESAQSEGAKTGAINPSWKRWYAVLLQGILTDVVVAPHICRQVRRWLTPHFRRIAFQQVLKGLGGFDHHSALYARRAAQGIGECGYPATALLLKILVWIYASSALVRTLFGWAATRRKEATTVRRAFLGIKYASLRTSIRYFYGEAVICRSVSDMQSDPGDQHTDELLITTVIPTYRRPHLLPRTILSVLGQTYPHVRVCVYDNASGDQTGTIVAEIKQCDSRVQYYGHQETIGAYENFNYGMQAVDTPYFSLLSDDDILMPGFYEEVMAAFDRYPDAMFVSMPTMVIDASSLQIISPPIAIEREQYYQPGEAVKGMLGGSPPVPGTWTGIVFRREVCGAIGFIDPRVGPHADGGFVCYVAARFPGVVLPGISAILFAHTQSVSGMSVPVSRQWIDWSASMMRRIFEDGNVSVHILDWIREAPAINYRAIGMKQVGRALANKNYAYALSAANGVKECGYPLAGNFLIFLVWLSEYSCVLWSLVKLKHIRDVLKRRRSRYFKMRYGLCIYTALYPNRIRKKYDKMNITALSPAPKLESVKIDSNLIQYIQ